MSLANHRHAILDAKKNEITAVGLSLGRKLRSLYLVTQFARGPPKPRELDYDAPLDPDGERFVNQNDITKGHTFNADTLSFPFEDATAAAPSSAKQTTLSTSPSIPAPSLSSQTLASTSVPSTRDQVSPRSRKQISNSRASSPPSLLPNLTADLHTEETVDATPNGLDDTTNKAVATRAATQTPSLDQAATSPSGIENARKLTQDDEKPETAKPAVRRAKVIHLPPKEEQERHLREIQRAQEGARLRERREDESLGLSVSVPGPDAVSSPSSTAGAYSTSTPKPPQHSPDTSPDAEYSPGQRDHLRDPNFEHETNGLEKNGHTSDRRMEMLSPPDTNATPEAQLRLEADQANAEPILSSQTTSSMGTDDRPSAESEPAKREPTEPTSTWKVPTKPSGPTDTEMQDASPIIQRKSHSSGKATAANPARPPPPEEPTRRLTRVASGAIRQKSVSEILGETPRPPTIHTSRRSSQIGPLSAAFSLRESLTTPIEDRDRSKHSLVVFTKKEKTPSPIRSNRYEPDGYLALKGASEDPEKDYLRPLFLHQAYVPPRATAFENLIQGAHKTLTTTNIYSNVREGIDYRILRRIYQLQNANKWSLRQMAKFPDPLPPVTHQDHLLAEMKWMRTDFREERKWKAAAARRLAEVCSIYIAAPEEVRVHMRVRAKIPPKPTNEVLPEAAEGTPELEHSMTESGESPLDEDVLELPPFDTVAPAALFSLGFDDVVFQLDPTPAGEGILNELPLYESKPVEPLPYFISADAARHQILPVSKFATGKLVPKPSGPPRKRSRYDYESEEDETVTGFQPRKRSASEVSLFLSPARRSPRTRELAPEETDVALFNPINRHIRDRLRANTAFRPPWEFGMPTTQFFENRIPSQWTWDEDQKLRTCVKKFSYNWSLIAMELQAFTQPSLFVAASERRTPWECFERWYQLEGLPNDMDKTAYFRTYRQRIEAANRTVAAQAAQQMQQQGAAAGQFRRRPSTQPYRVERRRDTRHVTMVDNIRKQARKRETALHRQQESAKASALRKQHSEANQPRNSGIHTPQEFSRMKHEREVKMAERQEVYRQQLMQQQQQRTAAMQRSQMPGQPPMQNGAGPQQRVATPNGSQGPGPSPPGQMPNGQNGVNIPQQRPPSQGMMQNGFPNGSMNGMGLNIPQAQMQAMQSQQRMAAQGSQENLHRMMVQQRAQQQYQTQMQHGGNNLAVAHLGNAIQNPQMMAALAAQRAKNGTQNGLVSPSMAAASPRAHPTQNQLAQQPQQLSSGHTPALLAFQQQVAAQFPHFDQQQVHALAVERLQGQVQLKRMQASAMSAASGSPAPMGNLTPMQQMGYNNAGNGMPIGSNGIPGPHSPTQYQQQLHRSMQQQQAAAARMSSGSPGMSNARLAGSRSATPSNGQGGLMMQRTASGNAVGDEGSPSMMQAQMSRP